MADPPKVSVVVPTYQRAAVVGGAVDSALAQTVEEIEVIVVDDGSTDDTEAVVSAFDDPRVQYVAHDRNRGRSAARNTGIAHAEGEYVAFLDSDDRWLPAKLERQLSVLEERSPEWIGAYCEFLTPPPSRPAALAGWLSRAFADPAVREGGRALAREILTMNVLMGPGSTLLVERAVLADTDGFDEELVDHEDWDLVLRLLAEGRIAHVDDPLVVVPESGGDPPAEVLVDAKRRFLHRHADLIDELEAEGTPIRAIHEVSIAGVFLREGRPVGALPYLGLRTLREPRNWLRLPAWTAVGLRHHLAGRPKQ
ncbi:glycosyltransferase [Saliphagus sp. LR7]|uniref:glycosyltransferase family 2 protein n=1 Tax=Saliphagus sp. LR7 TaxID=2282654 RepID=UPI000DF7D563|nr:glycosyltransferase [Saliphagus sp. LR7]